MEIGSISSVSGADGSQISDLMRNVAQSIEYHENKFKANFVEGLRPDSEIMQLPQHIHDQFARWDEQFTRPEEKKLVEGLKNKITEISLNGQDYIRERVSENSDKFRLEVAIKAVSKTTSGIQQLLSAQ